jgi:D-amino peptidase
MFAGVEAGCAAVFCVGYHARAADGRGVLSHTFTGPDVLWDIRLNDAPVSEARFNAALAGELGVPVALITGDDVICTETREWLPHVETAVVKFALDRFTARCLPQPVALERIRQAARQAMQRLATMQPYRLEPPVRLAMVFGDSSMAAAASRIPGAQRCGEREMRYSAPTVQEAYDVCSIALVLAGAVAKRERL